MAIFYYRIEDAGTTFFARLLPILQIALSPRWGVREGTYKCIKHRYILLWVANYSRDVRLAGDAHTSTKLECRPLAYTGSRAARSSHLNIAVARPLGLDRGRSPAVASQLLAQSLHQRCGKLKRKNMRGSPARGGAGGGLRERPVTLGMTAPRNTCIRSSVRNTGPAHGCQGPGHRRRSMTAYRATYHRTHSVPAVCRRTTK